MTTKQAHQEETTLLVLLVDRSGSMEAIRVDMEGGIRALLAEQAKEPGTLLVTLAQFDTEYELLADAISAPELVDYHLVPRGATALLDAMGRTISAVQDRVARMTESIRPDHVVVAVVTDGLENSSEEWGRDAVMKAVKERIDAGWHFTFIGANQDAIQEGQRMGVPASSSLNYAATSDGSQAAMSSLSASVRRMRSGEAAGIAYTEEERRASGN